MAFGGGALLFALSVELFGHVLHKFDETKESAPVWIMGFAAVSGGALFFGSQQTSELSRGRRAEFFD
jgi:purine-cytosine permease-like protein